LCNNLKSGDWDKGKKEPTFLFISRKNSIWEGKDWDKINDLGKVPNFKISFSKKDASNYKKENTGWGKKENYWFDENNNKITLTLLGNWPIPVPNTPPSGPSPQAPTFPQPKSKITWQLEYTGTSGSINYLFKIKSQGGLDQLVMIEQANPTLRGLRLKIGTQYKFNFWTEDAANPFGKTLFSENDTIELVEA
jgi:hypothetical protein